MSMEGKRQLERILRKLEKENEHKGKSKKDTVCCEVCGKELNRDTKDEVEYVKTKRGTELFVHQNCVAAWGK